jgi:amino acid permease
MKDVVEGTQTVSGSIYTLISTSIGTGVLGLPYSFYQSGIIISSCLLLIGALCAYFSMRVLMDVAFKVKKNNYAHLVDEILGKRWGVFLHIIFILTTYGITIIYIITFSVFTPEILIQFGVEY